MSGPRAGAATSLPRGTWDEGRVRDHLDGIRAFHLAADLSNLGHGERAALEHLRAAAVHIRDIHQDQLHREALAVRARLAAAHVALGRPARTRDLLRLFQYSDGPVAGGVGGGLEPFLGTDGWTPGRNFYPWGIGAEEVEGFLAAHPERRAAILGVHTVVRRTEPGALRRDLATLRRHAVLAGAHHGLAEHLGALRAAPDREALYAVPYAVAWPEATLAVSGHLRAAADAVADDDRDLAAFLRLRAVDLLTADLEPGDAAWVRGQFRGLDVVLGPHEVYDDDLFGVKASYGIAILARREAETRAIRHWVRHLPAIDRDLPYEGTRRADHRVPIASVDVVAATGHGRIAAAEILPNDADVVRRFGRKILVRHNVGFEPGYTERNRGRWTRIIVPEQADAFVAGGTYGHFITHEIAHFLGPDVTLDGRRFSEALGEDADLVEELKAESLAYLVTLRLAEAGELSAEAVRGELAVLMSLGFQANQPHRSQPYRVLRTMLFNRLRAGGVIVERGERLAMVEAPARACLEGLVGDLLGLQERGERAAVAAFIDRWSTWDETNERVARAAREVAGHDLYMASPLDPPMPGLEDEALVE